MTFLKIFAPILLFLFILTTTNGDILDDIENANEDIAGCLKVLGIDENKRKNYGQEDLKIYEERKRELEKAAKTVDYQKRLGRKVEKAKELLENLLEIRNINEQRGEDSVESNWRILDLKKGDRKGKNEVEKKAEERRKMVENLKRDGLPSDGINEAERALEGIESAKRKMKNFVKLRNMGGTDLDKMDVGALIKWMEELELGEEGAGKLRAKEMEMGEIEREGERMGEFLEKEMELPSKIEEAVRNRAKEKLAKTMEKLKNYVKYRELMEKEEEEETVEGHLKVIGGEMEELSREKVEKAKGKRVAEFQSQKEFPAGIELKRAIGKIEKSAEKLENYLRIRESMNLNEGKVEDLMKMMGMDIGRRERFGEEELRGAKEKMEKMAKKLPQGMEGTFKEAIEGAFEKLENFLKIRDKYLSRGETLEENLAILGIEKGKERSFDENDIQTGAKANLPPEEALPSDVKNIGEKVKNAEKKVRNYLLIRNINKWAKEDTVESNWRIMGLNGAKSGEEVGKAAEIMEEKIGEWKRGKELPGDGASMAKVEKAKEGIGRARTKLTNYLKLREMEKAELANEGVEELVKLIDFDGQSKLEAGTMDEAKIKAERWRIQREFLWKGENWPGGLKEEMNEFEGKKLRDIVERLRNYAKYRELKKMKAEGVEDHLRLIGRGEMGRERLTVGEVERAIGEREREFGGEAKLPKGADWAGIEEKIKESGRKLKNYIKFRDLVKKAEANRVEDLMEVLGIERASKSEMDGKMIEKARAEREAEFGNGGEFPAEGVDLRKAVEKIGESAAKLENYVLARDIAAPGDDRLKTHLAILGMEGEEKIDEKGVEKRRELLERGEQFPRDAFLGRAKNQIEISLGKVKKFILAREKSRPKDDKLETHFEIIGFEGGNGAKELSEEWIRTKLEEWRKMFKTGRDFPEDKDEERRNAKRQIESTAEKLQNFVKIRPLLEMKGKKIGNLMEMMKMNAEEAEKFGEEDLEKAKGDLERMAQKLPEGYEERVKQKVEEAAKRLGNYLKVRKRYLAKGNTLDENLVILGMEPGEKRNNYGKGDIERGMAGKLPKAEEMPSDVEKLDEKMKKAAEKLENNLLVREIDEIEGKNLTEKWKILGILDAKRQENIGQNELKAEFKKRREKLKVLPSDVDEDLAVKKLEEAYLELKGELERRKSEKIKRELEQKMRKENEEKERQNEEEEGRRREEADRREQRRPTQRADCQDSSPLCHLSILLCRNPENCKKSCGICVTSGKFECEDKNANCANWDRGSDFCSNSIYSKGMKLEFCAKTCKLCPE